MAEAKDVFQGSGLVTVADAIASGLVPAVESLDASTLNAQGDQGITLPLWALLHGNLKALPTLFRAGADPSIGDDEGQTVLHIAAKLKSPDGLGILLRSGITPDLRNTRTQATPIFDAILSDRQDQFNILLEHGADVNAQDDLGDTPLHTVAGSGLNEYALTLLEKGADPHIKNNTGHTCQKLFNVTPLSDLMPDAQETRKKIDRLIEASDG